MRSWILALAIVFAAASLALMGCSQAAPAPVASPTSAPKAAAEPTKAAAAPTEAPKAPVATATTQAAAKKSDFPAAGKSLTVIVGTTAGGPNDVAARLLAPHLEKELGIPVQILNKPGAGWQVGITEISLAKPDGYTIGLTPLPQTITIYMDPQRKAVFGKKDLEPLAMQVVDPGVIAVKADSPFKSVNDLVEAARANPEKIKTSDTGILSDDHLGILQLQKLTGVKFAIVHYEGTAQEVPALLGGHIDAIFGNAGDFLPQVKDGSLRVLGVMDREESKYHPGVKTMEAQGLKFYSSSSRAISMPAGAPKDVVDALSGAIKRASDQAEYKKKMDDLGLAPSYMDPAATGAYWTEMEEQVKPLMELAK